MPRECWCPSSKKIKPKGCDSKGMYVPGYRVGKSDDHAARKQKSQDNNGVNDNRVRKRDGNKEMRNE